MLITSSRKTSLKTRKFCKELEDVLPLSFYMPRGKKSLRSIIDLSYEKGMERLSLVETEGEEPCRMAFIEVDLNWQWLGYIDISVSLRGKRLPSVEEDIELSMEGTGRHSKNIAHFFNVSSEKSYAILYMDTDTINFYRKDMNNELVGPEIDILHLHSDANETNDEI